MTRSTLALAICTCIGFGAPALAQSVGAPAGRDPATAPGGTEGIAGARNEDEAIRRGDAVPVSPGVGIDVAAPPPMGMETAPPAVAPRP